MSYPQRKTATISQLIKNGNSSINFSGENKIDYIRVQLLVLYYWKK